MFILSCGHYVEKSVHPPHPGTDPFPTDSHGVVVQPFVRTVGKIWLRTMRTGLYILGISCQGHFHGKKVHEIMRSLWYEVIK